ncbi:MAG: hypothetical protein QF668_08855 [Arenicellales bacterium]|jgi:hypothetical protein|nr:hypothetical protein [Arenicellales bacterium]
MTKNPPRLPGQGFKKIQNVSCKSPQYSRTSILDKIESEWVEFQKFKKLHQQCPTPASTEAVYGCLRRIVDLGGLNES